MKLRRGLLLGFLLIVTAPLRAETIQMAATLGGGNEVPAIQTTGSGTAGVTLDTTTRTIAWDVRFQGLSGPVSAAHFHGPASATQNAPVVVPIAKAGDAPPLRGSATLTEQQMADLIAGRWYINIHTAAHPPGEIRGQVTRR